MAVAFDARSEATTNGATSLSWSHTCTGSDRVLYVAITHENGSTDVDAVTATYNGVSMAIFFTDTTTNANKHTRVFRLVAPATGANTIALDWGGLNRAFSAVAASFTGVDQTTPDDAQQAETNDLSGSTNQDRASAVGDMVVDVFVAASSVAGVAVNDGNTEINQIFASQTARGVAMSYEAGATTVTIGWAWTSGFTNFIHWTWNVNAATGGGTAVPVFTYNLRQQGIA